MALFNAETASASQLVPDSQVPVSLRLDRKLSKQAADSYLKARQSEDLRRDLAQRLLQRMVHFMSVRRFATGGKKERYEEERLVDSCQSCKSWYKVYDTA